jgi:hypothetical protein
MKGARAQLDVERKGGGEEGKGPEGGPTCQRRTYRGDRSCWAST